MKSFQNIRQVIGVGLILSFFFFLLFFVCLFVLTMQSCGQPGLAFDASSTFPHVFLLQLTLIAPHHNLSLNFFLRNTRLGCPLRLFRTPALSFKMASVRAGIVESSQPRYSRVRRSFVFFPSSFFTVGRYFKADGGAWPGWSLGCRRGIGKSLDSAQCARVLLARPGCSEIHFFFMCRLFFGWGKRLLAASCCMFLFCHVVCNSA